MSKILIIDCQGIGYKAHFAMGGMDAANTKTHIVFGFLMEVLRLAKKHETRNFIFCWDSRKNKRATIYPEYKKKRHEWTPEEKKERLLIFNQFKTLRTKVLPALGFKNIYIKIQYEADDLIATFCMQINDPKRSIIVSEDQDMLQLLDYCDIYKPTQKKFYKRAKFIKEWELEPIQWAEVKAIAGCSSDEVAGIMGVGEPTAARFIRGELKPHLKTYQKITSKEGQKIIKRNRELVTLPMKKIKLRSLKKEIFFRDEFIEVFENYGFKSFFKDEEFEKWQKLFQLR